MRYKADLKILQSDYRMALDFPKCYLCRNKSNNINFYYRPNREKGNDHNFQYIQINYF